MSRGPGRWQKIALDRILRAQEPLCFNRLAWEVAEDEAEVERRAEIAPGIFRGGLNSSFYKKFSRAIRSLCRAKRVTERRCKLKNTDELLACYPFKTLRLEVRDLRTRLLPRVVKFAQERGHVASSARIERDLFAREQTAPLREEWLAVRPTLHGALATSEGFAYDLILSLLINASHYFDHDSAIGWLKVSKGVAHEELSLGEQILMADAVLDAKTTTALKVLYRKAIPLETHQQRLLKDILFRVGEFRQGKRTGLSEHTKEALLLSDPAIVTRLPGFARGRRERNPFLNSGSGPTFGRHLDMILDRHALDPFVFLSVPQS